MEMSALAFISLVITQKVTSIELIPQLNGNLRTQRLEKENW